jgi:hypothetical protein
MACTVMRNVSQIYKTHAGPAMDDIAPFLNLTQQAGHRSAQCFSCKLATLVSDKGEKRLVSWCVCSACAESMATSSTPPKFDQPSQLTNPTPRRCSPCANHAHAVAPFTKIEGSAVITPRLHRLAPSSRACRQNSLRLFEHGRLIPRSRQ